MTDVLTEVADERRRQDDIWGQQDHPDGTGKAGDAWFAEQVKAAVDRAAGEGRVTWRLILHEEVREAFAEKKSGPLRTELLQVAAVATQWAEAIDRREDDR